MRAPLPASAGSDNDGGTWATVLGPSGTDLFLHATDTSAKIRAVIQVLRSLGSLPGVESDEYSRREANAHPRFLT